MANMAILKRSIGAALAAGLAALCLSAVADEARPSMQDEARDRAAEALLEVGGRGLGNWAREAVGHALERAGRAASESASGAGDAAPLPAGRGAAVPGNRRPETPEVLLFTSLSVPAASWRQWARDAARIGSPLVLRGVAGGGLRETAKQVGDRLGGRDAGVTVDPRLFRLFGIELVPTVAVVPGGVPPCASRGCANDPPPPFDLVIGNIGLAAALETVAAEGSAGCEVARRYLARLGGDR